MKTEFSELMAEAGSYSATGRATLYRKHLAADGKLDIAGGLVGVPFSASGPVNKPDFQIAKGAIEGAAIGTAIGGGLGARRVGGGGGKRTVRAET